MTTPTPSAPMHIPRQAIRGNPPPRGAARKAVEAVFAANTGWLTRERIAEITELPAEKVQQVLATLVAYRLIQTNRKRPPLYRRGTPPHEQPAGPTVQARAQDFREGGTYEGRELQAYTGRPGAMDAFGLPSLVQGRREPRRAPSIISSRSREAVR